MDKHPNRIYALRKIAGLSQQALADKVGCSKMQISGLERGSPELTVEWMRRIAKALRVDPADLLTENDNPFHLTDEERRLIEHYRASGPDQRALIQRVTEPLEKDCQQDAA